jgi:hypothetical protein
MDMSSLLRLRRLHSRLFWELQLSMHEQNFTEAVEVAEKCMQLERPEKHTRFIVGVAFTAAMACVENKHELAEKWSRIGMEAAAEVGDTEMREKFAIIVARVTLSNRKWAEALNAANIMR